MNTLITPTVITSLALHYTYEIISARETLLDRDKNEMKMKKKFFRIISIGYCYYYRCSLFQK